MKKTKILVLMFSCIFIFTGCKIEYMTIDEAIALAKKKANKNELNNDERYEALGDCVFENVKKFTKRKQNASDVTAGVVSGGGLGSIVGVLGAEEEEKNKLWGSIGSGLAVVGGAIQWWLTKKQLENAIGELKAANKFWANARDKDFRSYEDYMKIINTIVTDYSLDIKLCNIE